jgi:hypothetical protein
MGTLLDALISGFFLSVGIPCLFFPRSMQSFVIAFNARRGNVEPPSGFRRTPRYVRRLRYIGIVFVVLSLMPVFLPALANGFARTVI